MDGVAETFRTIFDDASLSLPPTVTPADIGGWDSLGMVLILSELGVRFDVRFTMREMDELWNVGDLVHVIGAKLADSALRATAGLTATP